MNKSVSTFLSVTLLVALLAAGSMAVARHGYPVGAVGMARLEMITNVVVFMPLAAVYAFSAMLMMILPLRAAGFIYANVAVAIHGAVLVLLAGVAGCVLARLAYGQTQAPGVLLDWRFLFAPAIIAAHLAMTALRGNVLLRSLSFVAFAVATLACLFWSFRL